MTISEQSLIAALCGFLCALILTKGIQVFAVKYRLLDTPNRRSSHIVPVPRLGGVAIVVATTIGSAIALQTFDWRIVVVAFGSILLAVTGLLDDLRPLRAWKKYTPQVVAAALAAMAFEPSLYIVFPYIDAYIRGVPAVLLSIIWITAVTNAFNFMDGIDGIATGVAIITAVVLAVMIGGTSVFILVPMAAALTGFLVWNMDPAIIFMGDVGSQFIGYLLSVAILMGDQTYVATIPVIVVFTPFLFDTGLTIVRRLHARENVFAAHRSHLYQRLIISGASHRAVANFYYGATVVSGLTAVAYASADSSLQLLLIVSGVCLLVAYAMAVRRLGGDLPLCSPSTMSRSMHGTVRNVHHE